MGDYRINIKVINPDHLYIFFPELWVHTNHLVSSKGEVNRVMKKRGMRNYSNNYSTTTAGHNGRMKAAELARDSVFALVPCKEMARGSGSLVLCAKKAKESGAQRRSKHKYEDVFLEKMD